MNATTQTNSQPTPSPTTAELLAQVPEPLRTRLTGAITAERILTYGIGLRHAAGNALKVIEAELANIVRQPCRPFCTNHVTTYGDGEICQGDTVHLNFDGPNRTAGHTAGASLGLTYAASEGDNAFVDLGEGPVYMSADDLRALSLAALKLLGDAR